MEVQKLASEFKLDQYPSSGKLFAKLDSKLNLGKVDKASNKEFFNQNSSSKIT